MPGLSKKTTNRVQATLLRCREFNSDQALQAVFATGELAPFRDGLPQASSRIDRVDQCIAYLVNKVTDGKVGLFLLLETLRDKYHPDDSLHEELTNLLKPVATELSDVGLSPTSTGVKLKHPRASKKLCLILVLPLLILAPIVILLLIKYTSDINSAQFARLTAFVVFITIAVGTYLGDRWRCINLGKWDNIVTISLAGVAVISLFVPIEVPVPNGPDCGISASEVTLGKDVIEINKTTSVTVHTENPAGRSLLFNWRATNGEMNPGLRTNSAQSIYTAPPNPINDTVHVEITSPGCDSLKLSKQISVILASITETPTLIPTDTPSPTFTSTATATQTPTIQLSPTFTPTPFKVVIDNEEYPCKQPVQLEFKSGRNYVLEIQPHPAELQSISWKAQWRTLFKIGNSNNADGQTGTTIVTETTAIIYKYENTVETEDKVNIQQGEDVICSLKINLTP